MHRDRIALLLFPMALALGVAVGCTDSDPVNPTGHAGTSGGGAGTTAQAGTSGGGAGTTAQAGTSGGSAGTTAAAGTTGGGAGTTAQAGTSGGGAGTTATAGTSGGAGSTGGGAGSTGGGAGTTAALSFANDIYPFLATQCMPCHTKATNQDGGPLDMSTAMKAYTSLLGTMTPPTGAPAKTDTGCKLLDGKKLRVEPGIPASSYLYIKVSNTDAMLGGTMNCGPAMPKTGSNLTLTADQKTKIHDWIMGGAMP